jgi:hypothetical protein
MEINTLEWTAPVDIFMVTGQVNFQKFIDGLMIIVTRT